MLFRSTLDEREALWRSLATFAMVSVVVSIRMRNIFAEVRKMFLDARLAEQDVRQRRLVRTSERNSCSYEPA